MSRAGGGLPRMPTSSWKANGGAWVSCYTARDDGQESLTSSATSDTKSQPPYAPCGIDGMLAQTRAASEQSRSHQGERRLGRIAQHA